MKLKSMKLKSSQVVVDWGNDRIEVVDTPLLLRIRGEGEQNVKSTFSRLPREKWEVGEAFCWNQDGETAYIYTLPATIQWDMLDVYDLTEPHLSPKTMFEWLEEVVGSLDVEIGSLSELITLLETLLAENGLTVWPRGIPLADNQHAAKFQIDWRGVLPFVRKLRSRIKS